MDKVLLELIKKIDNTFALVFIVVISIFIVFKKDLLMTYVRKAKLILKKSNNVKDLDCHDVFSTMIRVRNEVSHMKFYTHGEYDRVKTKMCFDFTRYKTLSCAKYMKEIIARKDIDMMSPMKLKNMVISYQQRMHEEYVNEIRKDWIGKGLELDNIEYVVRLFEKFRYDVVNSFEHRIISIFGSEFHEDNFERMLAVFEMWSMGIDLLPRDMNTTFESLNGTFKNIKY